MTCRSEKMIHCLVNHFFTKAGHLYLNNDGKFAVVKRNLARCHIHLQKEHTEIVTCNEARKFTVEMVASSGMVYFKTLWSAFTGAPVLFDLCSQVMPQDQKHAFQISFCPFSICNNAKHNSSSALHRWLSGTCSLGKNVQVIQLCH